MLISLQCNGQAVLLPDSALPVFTTGICAEEERVSRCVSYSTASLKQEEFTEAHPDLCLSGRVPVSHPH